MGGTPLPAFAEKVFGGFGGTPPHPLYLSLLWTFGKKKTLNSFDSLSLRSMWRLPSFVVAISIKHFVHKCASEDVKVTAIYLISQDHIDECSNVVASLIKR